MESLTEKINKYITESNVRRPKELLTGKRYLKDDMVYHIGKYIKAPHDFEKKLYNVITKQELKKTYYGLICVENDRELPKFIDGLTELLECTVLEYERENQISIDADINWFKVTFFAGLWDEIQKYNHSRIGRQNLIEDQVKVTPYDLIKRGYDVIHEKYAVRRNTGHYTRKKNIKIPGSQYFRLNDNKTYEILTEDISDLLRLFSLEKIDNEYHDFISKELHKKLNSVNDNVLRIATLLYGENLVNKYKDLEQNNLIGNQNNSKKPKKEKPRDISELPLFKDLFKDLH